MRKEKEISSIEGGMGKGGKGGGHTPVESNDTLQSQQTAKILLAISEGEIDSIEDIYLNHVPIANYDATWDFRPGVANQTTIPGFVDTEASLSGSFPIEITAATALPPYAIDSTADAARITFFVPSLSQYLENGDLVGTSIQLSVLVSKNNATYTLVKNITKSGKASSEYAWDVLVERPADYIIGSPWYIKVVRNTADSTSVKLNNKTHISGITKLFYKNLTYADTNNQTALVAITLRNADQFGGNIPDILIKGKFRKVKIPTNYDPVTRTYTGTWDLGFKPVKAFTSNIAWIIFDVLNNKQCLDIPQSDIDIVSFYLLSQAADQLIDDGFGDQIPRWHFGYQFVQRDNVPSFLANLLSICNAKLSNNEFGQISIIFDKAGAQPTKLITNANVIDGLFNYTSNDRESRTTQVNVTFNDITNFGETETVTVPTDVPTTMEQALIDRYGLQPTDIVLPGCRYKAQAMARARWSLYTNCVTTRFVSFKVFLQGLMFYVGETIKIMDSENQETTQHGVIVSYSQAAGVTTLTLDREFTIAAGSWSIDFTGTDGKTIYHKSINETNGTFSTFSYNSLEVPFEDSVFILNGTVTGQLYDVVSVKKEEESYIVLALKRDEAKYAYVDTTDTFENPTGDFLNRTDYTVEPIVNLTVVPVSSNDGVNSNIQLHVSWDWDLDHSTKFVANYRATWRRDNQDFQAVTEIQGKSFDINNAVPGTYEIYVWAINPLTGILSTPVTTVLNYRTSAGTSTLLPPINASTSQSSTTLTFQSAALTLYFYNNPTNDDNIEDSLYDYVVELWDAAGITQYGDYIVEPDANKNGIFRLPFAENVSRFGTAQRQFQLKLYSRDLSGFKSNAYAVTVNNPVPAAISYTLINGTGAAFFNISSALEADAAGYRIHRDTVDGFTPNDSNIVYDGPDTAPVIAGNTGVTYYYKAAAYDTFGKTGLNYGSQVSGNLLAAETDKFAFTGLTFTPNSPSTNQVSWTSGTVSINGASPSAISAGNASWSSGTLYICFDKTSSTLFTTTDITVAVTKSQILASYNGGTDLRGGDGTAFFNGGQILAQSVGVNQLVANSAIITNILQVQNGLLTNVHISNTANIANAKIANDLQSSDYSASNKLGWKIDKGGVIETYGALKIGTKNVGIGTPTLTFVPGALTLSQGMGSSTTLNNSIIQKIAATTAWDAQGYSTQSYTGDCACRFSFAQVTGECVAGLNTDPTSSADRNSIDFGIYVSAAGNVYKIESATISSVLTTYTVDDIFEIAYSGTTITYYKNGVSISTSTTTAGQTFFFDSSIYTQNAVIDQIQFGQYQIVTPDYGARMEITGDVLKVFDRNNTLRVKLGNLNA